MKKTTGKKKANKSAKAPVPRAKSKPKQQPELSFSWTDSDIRRFARAEWSRAKWSDLRLDPNNPDDIARGVAMVAEGIRWIAAAPVLKRDAVAACFDRWPVMATPRKSPATPSALGKKSDSPFLTKSRKAPNYGGTPANRIATAGMVAAERLRVLEAVTAKLPPGETNGTNTPIFSKSTARDAARWILGILDDYQKPDQALKKILAEARGWTPRKAKAIALALEAIGGKRTAGRAFPDQAGEIRDGYRERVVEAIRRLTP